MVLDFDFFFLNYIVEDLELDPDLYLILRFFFVFPSWIIFPLPNPSQSSLNQGSQKAAKDEEFGVTRGIDFKGVRTIINYDLPSSVQGYVHRVGRTGEPWKG